MFRRLGPWFWGNGGIETEIRRLHEEMDRVFSGSFHQKSAGEFPAVNIHRAEHGVVLTSELPGVEAADLNISVTGNNVTIGISRPGAEPQGAAYHRRERFAGKAARTIELPFTVEAAKVKASLTNGVLELTLPQAEAERPIKITLN